MYRELMSDGKAVYIPALTLSRLISDLPILPSESTARCQGRIYKRQGETSEWYLALPLLQHRPGKIDSEGRLHRSINLQSPLIFHNKHPELNIRVVIPRAELTIISEFYKGSSRRSFKRGQQIRDLSISDWIEELK